VDTAIVKGLNASYMWNVPDGLPRRAILRPAGASRGHVFHHIYENARYLYIPAVKQQASFLITGLVIIEMALNIQGHLCYELMQNILYRDYEVAAGIVIAIFLVVKATEVMVDIWFIRESRRYENANA
jgi:ABC-type dipeptide/oligopeptide/nickel transport system permease component